MKNRYKLPKHIQIQYLRNVELVSGLTGNNLAILFGVVGRSYRDWRRGKFTIPQNAVSIIEKRYHIPFPGSKNTALNHWKRLKNDASRRGGIVTMQKYGGPGTPEGRKRGGKKGILSLRTRGLIPRPKPFRKPKNYSQQLAEFVGILLGDGHIGKEQWSITLNSIADKEYVHFVYKCIQNLFHFNPAKYERSDSNVIILSGSGIRSIKYFTNIGLKIGNKVKQQVGIPEWIRKKQIYKIACLRGLIDTDGGIFTHSYSVNGKIYSYRKLAFVNRSMPLLRFAYDTMRMLGLTPKMIDKVVNKRVWLYNQQEVITYLKIVGTHNPRLCPITGGVR